MQRKVALVGCRESQWIRVAGLRELRVNARVQRDVMFNVVRSHGPDDSDIQTLIGPGLFDIEPTSWAKIIIVDGPHIDAMIFLEAA